MIMEVNSITELTQNINVMDAVHWIQMAWNEIIPTPFKDDSTKHDFCVRTSKQE